MATADDRPDPESLLIRARLEEDAGKRGKLKVFLGAAPGVGKTYAMLEEARRLSSDGIDVVVAYVEPHVRPDTAALLLGLDLLPARSVVHRGLALRELDLDAVLARRPALAIVDELAHSNAPGARHPKRWQDVEELLDAGIDVSTTLNIQHVESLRDVVARITGVSVRETVPDSVLDQAAEIELVDLAPEELMARLESGKVYVPAEANRAFENFFRRENLIALRELSLRQTAERVGVQLEDYRRAQGDRPIWHTSDRLLVCVGPSPFSARLVRATRRMAAGLKAPWLAVHVETSRNAGTSQADRDRLSANLRLAEDLGAEVVRLAGENVPATLVDFARRRNVTKIVVGKPLQPRWQELFRGSLVYELTRNCGEIDVYVISGERDRPAPVPESRSVRRTWDLSSGAWAVAVVGLSTAVGFLLEPYFELSNIVLVYLLGVIAVAAVRGRPGAAVASSILGVCAFDYCFVPPRFTFAVADVQYLLTFGIMLAAGLLTSGLTARLRQRAEWARERESVVSALYAMSRTLSSTPGLDAIVREAALHLASVFGAKVAVLLPGEGNRLSPSDAGLAGYVVDEHELEVAQWAFEHREPAGLGTTTLPSTPSLYQPLQASISTVGVVGLRPEVAAGGRDPDWPRLIETFASQVALAIERAKLAARAREIETQMETERLRNALLSAVSHDLRTPLASIMGSSSTLVEQGSLLSAETRKELAEAIFDEAERLNRIVANLLDVTRLEAGSVVLQREWQSVEEILGIVLNRLSRSLSGRPIATRLPPDLPLVPVDAVLIEQVLFNLVDNASRHTPAGTPIDIGAEAGRGEILISVADRGSGVPAGEEDRIFEKFHRAPRSSAAPGTGLGLTVAKGIVTAHGGRIWVERRPEGGAIFRFTLPIVGVSPALPLEVALPPADDTPQTDNADEAPRRDRDEGVPQTGKEEEA